MGETLAVRSFAIVPCRVPSGVPQGDAEGTEWRESGCYPGAGNTSIFSDRCPHAAARRGAVKAGVGAADIGRPVG